MYNLHFVNVYPGTGHVSSKAFCLFMRNILSAKLMTGQMWQYQGELTGLIHKWKQSILSMVCNGVCVWLYNVHWLRSLNNLVYQRAAAGSRGEPCLAWVCPQSEYIVWSVSSWPSLPHLPHSPLNANTAAAASTFDQKCILGFISAEHVF